MTIFLGVDSINHLPVLKVSKFCEKSRESLQSEWPRASLMVAGLAIQYGIVLHSVLSG